MLVSIVMNSNMWYTIIVTLISNGHIKIIVLCQILLWVPLDEQFQNTLDEEAELIDSVLVKT